MHRYNIVLLILLILSIINFGLPAPVLIPEKSQVCVDVVHVSKDMKTMLGKRGGMLGKMANLFEYLDRWWGRNPGSSSTIRPPSSSASSTSEWGPVSDSEYESMPSSESSTRSDWGFALGTESDSDYSWMFDSVHESLPGSESNSDLESMPSSESDTESMPSLESASDDEGQEDPDHESMDVDHDAPPPSPESSIEPEHFYTLLSSLKSDSGRFPIGTSGGIKNQ